MVLNGFCIKKYLLHNGEGTRAGPRRGNSTISNSIILINGKMSKLDNH
nr:MAG TPA: hypothetical protein [Caudoviricetes sp.]DAV65497.1 MAG TPA: hypothetical protein [Caudoviricetes sp.]DAW25910.1 MAG TPA: hypothetical protein [Caudoviricetes sp.]